MVLVLFFLIVNFALILISFIFIVLSLIGPDTTELDLKDGRKIPKICQKAYGLSLLALILLVIINGMYV